MVTGTHSSVREDANGDGTCEMTLARYRYDDLGRMIRTDYQPTGSTGSSYILYAWQDDGDLDAMRHVFGSQTKDFAYDYNANGELTATYASDASWLWSASSARTINYAPANERNEMLSWTEAATTTTALYDANGNYRGNGVNDLAIHNSQNQLVSLAMSGTTASYQYGPMGRRIETTIAGTRTRFLHSGDMEIAELVDMFGQWKIKTRYIPGLGVDQRVAMINVNTFDGSTLSREYYHADRLGSVIAMAAEDGSVTANYVYTPFGVEDYGASGNPFRYTGRRWDAQVGLYYYRARYYDPELGRFLETDPVLYADQMNLYAYVGNNPLNATDPTGMCAVDDDGNITDCEITLPEGLTEGGQEIVDDFLVQVAELGMEIQENGTDDQKAAREAITELEISFEPGPADSDSQALAWNEAYEDYDGDGRTDDITFFSGAIFAADLDRAHIISHEIFHSSPEFANDRGSSTLESMVDEQAIVFVMRHIKPSRPYPWAPSVGYWASPRRR